MTLSSDTRWKIETGKGVVGTLAMMQRLLVLEEIGDAMAADMGAMRENLIKARQALHDINDALSGPANFSEAFERERKARDIAREAFADTAKLLAAEAAMKGEKG